MVVGCEVTGGSVDDGTVDVVVGCSAGGGSTGVSKIEVCGMSGWVVVTTMTGAARLVVGSRGECDLGGFDDGCAIVALVEQPTGGERHRRRRCADGGAGGGADRDASDDG